MILSITLTLEELQALTDLLRQGESAAENGQSAGLSNKQKLALFAYERALRESAS